MAGDWIKFELSTFDKPEVIQMADALNMPESHVVGCLLQVWAWFDQQTEDGNAYGVTTAFVDRRVGVKGFADAMLSTGWLAVIHREEGDMLGGQAGLSMPGFEEHNGKSAKKRALTARRVRNHKANAMLTPNALPREEKSIKTPTPQSGASGRQRSPREEGTNSRAKGTNPRATVDPVARASKDITGARTPGCLAQAIDRHGLGIPPAGMAMEDAKRWALAKLRASH